MLYGMNENGQNLCMTQDRRKKNVRRMNIIVDKMEGLDSDDIEKLPGVSLHKYEINLGPNTLRKLHAWIDWNVFSNALRLIPKQRPKR